MKHTHIFRLQSSLQLVLPLAMFAVFILTAKPTHALTLTGGGSNSVITTNSNTVIANPLTVTCDAAGDIDKDIDFYLYFWYAKTAGTTLSPLEFDNTRVSDITITNQSGVNVVALPSVITAGKLKFEVTTSCTANGHFTINNLPLKRSASATGSEGTVGYEALSLIKKQFSPVISVDTLGPTIIEGSVFDNDNTKNEGKPTGFSLLFSEDVVYTVNQFSNDFSLVPIASVNGATVIGELSITPGGRTSAGPNVVALSAPVSGAIATSGSWTITPKAGNTVKDANGNPALSTSFTIYDTLSPVVKNVSPSALSVAPKNGDIIVTFSEPMNSSALLISTSPSMNYTTSWSINKEILTIKPTNQVYATQYSITVSGPSLAGDTYLVSNVVAPALPSTWNFSTASAPAVPVPDPTVSNVIIASGTSETTSIFSSVSITSGNADFVRFGENSDMKNASPNWLTISNSSYPITLTPGSGTKTVCAQTLASATGKISSVSCDTVVFKFAGLGVPSNPSLSINDGASIATSQTALLRLGATDATKMAVSSDISFVDAQWENFSSTRYFALSSSSGIKNVYAMFASATGAVTPTISASITYAPNGLLPSGSLSIEGGAIQTATIYVNLNVSGSNVDQVRFATLSNMTDAQSFQTLSLNKAWTFAPGVGNRQVCAEFRNSSNGTVSPIACDTIELISGGAGAPSVFSVAINNGAVSTDSQNVIVNVTSVNASLMAFSNTSDFAGSVWENYSTTKQWTFNSVNGIKTVYVMFASGNGSVTSVYSDSINLAGESKAIVTPSVGSNQSSTVLLFAPSNKCSKKSLSGGLISGMLVKRFDLKDVYYVGEDGCRYAFPNQKVFLSWYTLQQLNTTDKGGLVVTVAPSTLASMQLAGNVTYRPGVRMIKNQLVNTVYVIDSGAILRPVASEVLARLLYGDAWNYTSVDDFDDVFWFSYGFGTPISTTGLYYPSSVKDTASTIGKAMGLTS